MVYFATRVTQVGAAFLLMGSIIVTLPFIAEGIQQLSRESTTQEESSAPLTPPEEAPAKNENIEKCRKDKECQPLLHWSEQYDVKQLLVQADGKNEFKPYYDYSDDYNALSGLYEELDLVQDKNKFKDKTLKYKMVEGMWQEHKE